MTRSCSRLAGVLLALLILAVHAPGLWAAPAPRVYVILWFDTEDYLLPASDDAALRVADFLSAEGIRATFKVVGEKARTLEQRKRTDVIAALKKHEIGYHSNYHSVQPTPALYLDKLGWDEGVAEFDRRESRGRADVERIFGQAPTCYGQPGSSWGPQTYGTMNRWNMKVYLDAGRHVDLDAKPCYYCGILNLYRLEHTLRADLNAPEKLGEAEEKFVAARKKILAEGGGLVSIYYHPCEFVHKEFWDGVNFSKGANPPRENWRQPKAKTPEESQRAYDVFQNYIRFLKRFPEVQFITASEAARLYADKTRGRAFSREELLRIASGVGADISFQRHDDHALTAAEILALLNGVVAQYDKGEGKRPPLRLTLNPIGPTGASPPLTEPVETDWSQFQRSAQDVADYLDKHGRVPGTVWLGSTPVPPEAFLRALAEVAVPVLNGKPPPETVTVRPAKLAAGQYVAEDDPKLLWGWVIFPPGFHAPALMELARRQAWALKPALLSNPT